MWTDITSWIADKTAGLKILAADFNTILNYIKIIYVNLTFFEKLSVGKSLKYMNSFVPVAPDHPWFCLSYSTRVQTTANYSAEYIAEKRSRKLIYDEAGTPTSAYSGSWSGNVFTLANNAANNAMLAELAEDWIFHGSPTSAWRILHDGTNEFNITNIVVSTRQITVNLDGKTAAGTTISIYLNRVYGSTTSCRHFSEAGLASYQAGGSKFNGLLRRDKIQRLTGSFRMLSFGGGSGSPISNPQGLVSGISNTSAGSFNIAGAPAVGQNIISLDSANSPDARTSPATDGETQVKSGTDYKYEYVGSYTA